MARIRSPGYPSFPLEQVIEFATKIHSQDRQHPVDRETAARHMGFSGLSGTSDRALSALMHYNLIERVKKGELRVTDVALRMIHPDSPAERRAALHDAGFAPGLFKELRERYPGEPPSRDSLSSYLSRSGFASAAIPAATKSYLETCYFLQRLGAYESGLDGADDAAEPGPSPDTASDSEVVYGGARVGDLVDWEVEGALGNSEPLRIRALSEDGSWAFVDGSETGLKMDQLIVKERASAAPEEAPRMALNLGSTSKRDDPPVAEGYRSEKFDADEGVITISWPTNLSLQSVEDMKIWLSSLETRLARRAGTPAN